MNTDRPGPRRRVFWIRVHPCSSVVVFFDYGQDEGKTTAEIREQRPDWNLFHDGCPGGESPMQVLARVDQVIARVMARDGANGAIFSHGHFLRVFTTRWLGWPLEAANSLQ